jgi:hypothetical protein
MKVLPFMLIYGSIAGLGLVICAVIWFPMIGQVDRSKSTRPEHGAQTPGSGPEGARILPPP